MSLIDWAALALFFASWLGYNSILGLIGRRGGSLNADMAYIRTVWMQSMTHRELKLVDSQLMGHSINSASFFASTNLLLIAAVGGILFGGETALKSFASVGAEAVPVPLLEAKLALILACLARGLLDFIWSIRQMNYCLAVIGAAPETDDKAFQRAYGDTAARLLNPALSSFNRGVRGYYFALAAAAWLFGPAAFILTTLAAMTLLFTRQRRSPAARAVGDLRRMLEKL